MPSGVAAAVAVLRDAYPRADFPERTATLYGAMLADLDDRQVAEAVHRLVRRSTFLPTIAEIRREVAERILRLPTAPEAWEMVLDQSTRGKLPTPVQQSLQFIGGRYTLRMTDQPGILRVQFLRDYEARRETALLGVMGADPAQIPGPTMAALPESTSIRPAD